MKIIDKSKLKYLYLFLADISVCLLVFVMINVGKNFLIYYPITFADIMLLFAPPIVCIIRGVLSRIFIKRTLVPFLMLFFELWIGLLIACIIYMVLQNVLSSLLYSVYITTIYAVLLSVISALFSLFTGGIIRLFKAAKEITNSPTK